MKHVQTLNTRKLQNTVKKGGCGECQTSCQSACKTSCTVGNQTCEQCKQAFVCTKKMIKETVRVADGHLLHLHLNQVEAFTAETV